jgi:hypothetical protein
MNNSFSAFEDITIRKIQAQGTLCLLTQNK